MKTTDQEHAGRLFDLLEHSANLLGNPRPLVKYLSEGSKPQTTPQVNRKPWLALSIATPGRKSKMSNSVEMNHASINHCREL